MDHLSNTYIIGSTCHEIPASINRVIAIKLDPPGVRFSLKAWGSYFQITFYTAAMYSLVRVNGTLLVNDTILKFLSS